MPSVLLASDRCFENLTVRRVGNNSHVLFLYNPIASKIFFFLITLAAPSLVYLVFPQTPIYQRNCFRIHML